MQFFQAYMSFDPLNGRAFKFAGEHECVPALLEAKKESEVFMLSCRVQYLI